MSYLKILSLYRLSIACLLFYISFMAIYTLYRISVADRWNKNDFALIGMVTVLFSALFIWSAIHAWYRQKRTPASAVAVPSHIQHGSGTATAAELRFLEAGARPRAATNTQQTNTP